MLRPLPCEKITKTRKNERTKRELDRAGYFGEFAFVFSSFRAFVISSGRPPRAWGYGIAIGHGLL
jgi:hypothetical protein